MSKLKLLEETLIFPTVHTYARTVIPAARMTIRSTAAKRFFPKCTISCFIFGSFCTLKKRMSEQVGGRSSEEKSGNIYINHMPSMFHRRSMNIRSYPLVFSNRSWWPVARLGLHWPWCQALAGPTPTRQRLQLETNLNARGGGSANSRTIDRC
jgi:hypothetical protein